MRKKFLLSFLLSFMAFVTLVSCGKKDSNVVDIYLPDGTPALAVANMLDDGFESNGKKAEFHFVAASQIATSASLDECDMAIMPTIAAAQIFNKGIDIKLASTNVFGNLYIVGTGDAKSVDDLKGKVIYTTSGTTIAMLQYILRNNNVEYVTTGEAVDGKVSLSSKADASEIIPLLKQAATSGNEAYGVLGEPAVTQAMNKVGDSLKIAIDFQQEYNLIKETTSSYPQASLVVKNKLIESNKTFVDAFLLKMSENKEYCLNNLTELPTIFAKYESSLKAMSFTSKTIERCNLGFVSGQNVKSNVITYVYDLGNITVGEEFFY